MKILQKLKYYILIIRSIPINIKYLPFNQAIKIPIFLTNSKFIGKGRIVIESNEVYRGMINLGAYLCPKYPRKGITIENNGCIVFKGACTIGNNSFISIGKRGTLIVGDNLVVNSSVNIICARKIVIGKNNLFGWETTIMDTSFHPLYDRENHSFLPATAPSLSVIIIGLECKLL